MTLFMFIFSTILYFGEEPAGYDVYREEGTYVFMPTPNAKDSRVLPSIQARQSAGTWEVSGVEGKDLVSQVIRLIAHSGSLGLFNPLSAAC